MRQLKFRVWNSSISTMFPVYGFDERQIKYRRADGSLGAFAFTGNAKKRISIMQFTGLQDKNGKDIYDGDLVLWGFKGEETAQIRWSETHFEWEIYVLPPRSPHSPPGMRDFWNDRIEVIGNIYENPELLTK